MRRIHVIVGLFALAAAWLTIGGTATASPARAERITVAEAAAPQCAGNCPQKGTPDCTGLCSDQQLMCAPPGCWSKTPDPVPQCSGNCPQDARADVVDCAGACCEAPRPARAVSSPPQQAACYQQYVPGRLRAG